MTCVTRAMCASMHMLRVRGLQANGARASSARTGMTSAFFIFILFFYVKFIVREGGPYDVLYIQCTTSA